MSIDVEARAAAARLMAEGVVGVVLGYVDVAGLHRVKAVPVRGLEHAVRQGVGMSPVFDTFLVDDSTTSGRFLGGPSGDLRLFPDLDRLVPLAAQPGWAWAPADRYRQDGTPHPACHRQFARRMTARAADRGIELRAGYEVEWVVAKLPSPDPAGPGATASADAPLEYPTEGPAYGMHRVTDLSDYLRDLLQALAAEELTVLQIHPEYSPGQFELSFAPEDPVGAADTAVLVRATVRAVSARHGLRASFAPVVEAGGVGNGGHLHLSLWREGRNLGHGGPGPYGLTAEAESFLAGVLEELPALLAVGAPSPAGYLRLVPSHWAGAYRCWGHENREAALRLVTGGPREAEATANAELKCIDQAANPYLLAGAMIAAGLAGIDAGLKLPPETFGDPAHLPADQAPPRLPERLDAALDAFERSQVLRDALGEALHDTVCAVRRAEIALFAGRTPEEIAAATRWRY